VKSVVLLLKQEETNQYLYIMVDLDYVIVVKRCHIKCPLVRLLQGTVRSSNRYAFRTTNFGTPLNTDLI